MFEKVNPSHPDKLADRIAGAIVDLAYTVQENPRIAVEVLLGHGYCHIIAESSVHLSVKEVGPIVRRIAGEDIFTNLLTVPQDFHLADNQVLGVRCGDNGIFKGCPVRKHIWRGSRMVVLPDYQGVGVASAMRLEVAESFRKEGTTILSVTSNRAMIASMQKSPAWKCVAISRKNMRSGAISLPHQSGKHRITASFEFIGKDAIRTKLTDNTDKRT